MKRLNKIYACVVFVEFVRYIQFSKRVWPRRKGQYPKETGIFLEDETARLIIITVRALLLKFTYGKDVSALRRSKYINLLDHKH